jgi:Arc/MetJ-type ribon-helix-helix transcriptional regulator
MATKNQLSVALDESSYNILEELKKRGNFKDEATIVQEALHCLYREINRRASQPADTGGEYVGQASLNPDDFE